MLAPASPILETDEFCRKGDELPWKGAVLNGRFASLAKALEEETKLGLRRFEVCDNVDLETILMEYESYYFVMFQKYPKVVKKAPDPGT